MFENSNFSFQLHAKQMTPIPKTNILIDCMQYALRNYSIYNKD